MSGFSGNEASLHNNGSFSRENLERALYTLYMDVSNEHKRQADQWLKEFQRSPEAWQISDQILSINMPNLSTEIPSYIIFFAAQTIHTKIREDFDQLPVTTYVSLKNSLLQHLLCLTRSVSAPKIARTQICLALICLIIQVQDWKDNIVSSLTEHLSASINGFSQGDCGTCLLELLQVLPEEVEYYPMIDDLRREELFAEMKSSMGTVFQLIDKVLQHMHNAESQASVPIRLQATQMGLKCYRTWIRHVSSLNRPNNTAGLILSTWCLQSLFHFLKEENLFDDVIDVLIDLFRVYVTWDSDQGLIHFLIHKTIDCKPMLLESIDEEDADRCRGLCLVFTEMAESYLDFFFQYESQRPLIDLPLQFEILEAMLRSFRFPDIEIVEVSTPFWFRFLDQLYSIRDSAKRQGLLQTYSNLLIHLVHACIHALEFPVDVMEWSRDRKMDFKNFRELMGDILRDCCRLVDVRDTLRDCINQLRIAAATSKENNINPALSAWQRIEAVLYTVRALARDNSVLEMQDELKALFDCIPSLPSSHPAIRYTATLLINRYSKWICDHPEYIQILFPYIQAGLTVTFSENDECLWLVSSAAAMALRSLCKDGAQHVGNTTLALYQQLTDTPIDVDVIVLEGLCSLVSQCVPGEVMSALQLLVNPIVGRIQVILSKGSSCSIEAAEELKRIMCILEYIQPKLLEGNPHPVVLMVDALWETFEKVISVFHSKDSVIELICRCYKRVMRNCGENFSPLLPRLTDHLIQSFSLDPKSSYLYCASICVCDYGDKPAHMVCISSLVHHLSQRSFALLSSERSMADHPDIIEEYFFLVERCLTHSPQILSSICIISSVVLCGITSLKHAHNEANKSVLNLLEKLLEFIGEKSHMPLCDEISAVFGKYGPDIFRALIKAVEGTLAGGRLDGDKGSISGVLMALTMLDRRQSEDWIGAILSEYPESAMTAELKRGFFTDLRTANDRRSFDRLSRNLRRLLK